MEFGTPEKCTVAEPPTPSGFTLKTKRARTSEEARFFYPNHCN